MRILLAIDDSKFSKAALQTVLARGPHAQPQVLVLHVVESPTLLVGRDMAGDAAMEKAWEQHLEGAAALVDTAARTLRSKGVKATTSVERGSPKSKIIDVASKWHADLVVVGAHGRSGLDRFLIGSVSEAVARHAPCSVEIVRIRRR